VLCVFVPPLTPGHHISLPPRHRLGFSPFEWTRTERGGKKEVRRAGADTTEVNFGLSAAGGSGGGNSAVLTGCINPSVNSLHDKDKKAKRSPTIEVTQSGRGLPSDALSSGGPSTQCISRLSTDIHRRSTLALKNKPPSQPSGTTRTTQLSWSQQIDLLPTLDRFLGHKALTRFIQAREDGPWSPHSLDQRFRRAKHRRSRRGGDVPDGLGGSSKSLEDLAVAVLLKVMPTGHSPSTGILDR